MNNATVCTKIVVTNLVDYSYTAELIETIALFAVANFMADLVAADSPI
jgi:hypothetical protein